MSDPESDHRKPGGLQGDCKSASALGKTPTTTRKWPSPLAEDADTVSGKIIWFGNEGDDIDPRFERDETV